MKRDTDLCRAILLEIESHPTPLPRGGFLTIEIPNCTEEQISYHIRLLHQAGLVEATDYSTGGKVHWLTRDLTWQGYELLDAYRDNTKWQKAKKILQRTAGSVTLEGLNQLIPRLIAGGLQGTLTG